jgi:GNAT superfamily N-acetyltransferase
LSDLLLAAGYAKRSEEVWMLCPLADAPTTPPAPHLTICQLSPTSAPNLLAGYVRCFTTNFGVPPHTQAGFDASFCGVLSHPQGQHWVALVDGQVAGALSLLHNGEVGGVYNVGTFAEFRGQGVATALLHHLLGAARALGLHTLLLQTRHQGPAQPIYARVGFRPHFVRDWYLPDAPRGIWSE